MAATNPVRVVCLNNAPTSFSGFITRRHSYLPFSLSSVSTSFFCSSSSYSPVRSLPSSPPQDRSFLSHITASLVGGDPGIEAPANVSTRTGIQPLGGKEKKELRAYAHGLGTRLNVQQVGKLGVSSTVLISISDALEANEIVKVKVLENCASEMSEIIIQLERGTRGQVVGKIGRTVLLYRASLKKLAAAEAAEKRTERTRLRSKR